MQLAKNLQIKDPITESGFGITLKFAGKHLHALDVGMMRDAIDDQSAGRARALLGVGPQSLEGLLRGFSLPGIVQLQTNERQLELVTWIVRGDFTRFGPMGLRLCEIFLHLGQTSRRRVVSRGLFRCLVERVQRLLRGSAIIHAQSRPDEAEGVVEAVRSEFNDFAPPIQCRLISGSFGDLCHETGGIGVFGINLQGPPGAQHRRLRVTPAEIGGGDADQMALLPLMKKMQADNDERNQKNQTENSAHDELDESPFVFLRGGFQWLTLNVAFLKSIIRVPHARISEGVSEGYFALLPALKCAT